MSRIEGIRERLQRMNQFDRIPSALYIQDVTALLTALDEAERENERLREALHQIAHLTILPTDSAAMVYGRAVRMTVLAGAALDAVKVTREEG